MNRNIWLLPLAVSLVLLAPAVGDDAKPDPDKKVVVDVLAKLKEKRDRGWNERYKLEMELPTGTDTHDFQIDWKTGMFRLQSTVTSAFPHEGLEVYDGKQLKTHFRLWNADRTPKGDWKYGLVTGELTNHGFGDDYRPMFHNRGVIPVFSQDRIHPGHLTFDLPDPSTFYVYKQDAKGGKGARFVTLRTFPEDPVNKSFREYTFDLDKDCAVTEFRFSNRDEIIVQTKTEFKQWDKRWAPLSWTVTLHPDRPPNRQTVTKVRVTSFAADVPVTDENAYDVVPPEGAKVGRSDFRPTDTPGSPPKLELYEYVVKDGKLEQISGPVSGAWAQSGNRRWGVVAAPLARFVRRLAIGRKA